jgi:hypothetical protein
MVDLVADLAPRSRFLAAELIWTRLTCINRNAASTDLPNGRKKPPLVALIRIKSIAIRNLAPPFRFGEDYCKKFKKFDKDSEYSWFRPICNAMAPYLDEASTTLAMKGTPEMVVNLVLHLVKLTFINRDASWDPIDQSICLSDKSRTKFDQRADQVLYRALKKSRKELLSEPGDRFFDPEHRKYQIEIVQEMFDAIDVQRKMFYAEDDDHARKGLYAYDQDPDRENIQEDTYITKSYHLLWSWIHPEDKHNH